MPVYRNQLVSSCDHVALKQKVLLIDDQPLSLTFAYAVLDDVCLLISASSSEDGLQLALSEQPDLILLDVRMPHMDGFEVCRRLKQNPATAHIAVIFLTTLDEEAEEEFGLNLGAIDYISKPFNPAVLRARVRNHLLTSGNANNWSGWHTVTALPASPIVVILIRSCNLSGRGFIRCSSP